MGKKWKLWQTIFLRSKITADGDYSHEIKRHLLLRRKAMTNLDSILKSRNITLPTKVCTVKAMVFPFPSPVDLILSEPSTMTHPFWVALHGMAHSFTELDKAVIQVISLVIFKCSLLLGRKAMTNLDSILRSRHITLPTRSGKTGQLHLKGWN